MQQAYLARHHSAWGVRKQNPFYPILRNSAAFVFLFQGEIQEIFGFFYKAGFNTLCQA